MFKKVIRRLIPKMDLTALQNEGRNSQIAQRSLFLELKKQGKDEGEGLIDFSDMGFRVYSQGDEDGKLLYIFSQIGFTDKKCVDIAFASPFGSNSTNLILNWGFHALLVEGNEMQSSQKFFHAHPDSTVFPPKTVHAWVTTENVNKICQEAGFTGEIDFLSLDMDGVDYHIWKALEVLCPRVVLVEYNDILGWEEALTVPYSSDFDRKDEDFFGASLKAFVLLAKKKGYRLVGTNHLGYNAFFVKNGLGEGVLPEIDIQACFKHPKVLDGIKYRYPKVAHLPWLKVD